MKHIYPITSSKTLKDDLWRMINDSFACAGGGRAGCTKKDFYGTNLKTENLKKALKK